MAAERATVNHVVTLHENLKCESEFVHLVSFVCE